MVAVGGEDCSIALASIATSHPSKGTLGDVDAHFGPSGHTYSVTTDTVL